MVGGKAGNFLDLLHGLRDVSFALGRALFPNPWNLSISLLSKSGSDFDVEVFLVQKLDSGQVTCFYPCLHNT
jgi:hypothetical protein